MQVLWFRRDLRLDDHPALVDACRRGPVLPLFILDAALLHHPETGPARVAFLLASLRALDHDLRRRGSRLLVRQGEPAAVLLAVVRQCGADGVVAHVDTERLVGRVRDARVSSALARAGIPLRWLEPPGCIPHLLAYPDWRRSWHGEMALEPLPAPSRISTPPPQGPPEAAAAAVPGLAELGLEADGKPIPAAGTSAALELLERFRDGGAAERYFWQLSLPSARATTGLGPYLKFGVISHRQVLHTIAPLRQGSTGERRSWRQLVSRLRWGAGMAQRFRYLPQLELRPLWDCYEEASPLSAEQEELYAAWQSGRTGFPLVDAAARCLLASGGWLDLNFRSRAIHASFLTNLCGIDWRYGALHYMRHLIDGDCCIDHYQWAMQAGVTAAGGGRGWSRIYHPGRVAVERCDPQGLFIRRWLPELADLTNDQLGSPPLMASYPRPLLDYEQARRRRLGRLERQRQHWRPHGFSRMPADLSPFGAERISGSEVDWASPPAPELSPAALPLEQLDPGALGDLASWFSASRSLALPPAGAQGQRGQGGPRRRRGTGSAADAIQLELW
ncbi:FAD-binding domain-containing protein [Cyanobium sp. CH-040]|uniref:FAD-binding domain-containing protein n=1 Tax=Cyanobium sp. CH-040 TaxID=2823708 RepID=UPI0020CE8EDC|nr:FAD-binding domain-containing protein [Cyanobium sp. CH-040]